jgi:PASTA domain
VGPIRKLIGTCLVVTVWMLVAAGVTGASAAQDLRGTWSCCGSGGAAAQTWTISSMNLASGSFSGHGAGNAYTFPIKGRVSGSSVTLTTGPYKQLPTYSATFTGKVSGGGARLSGSWKSNESQTGSWTAARTSKPPPVKKGSVTCKVPKLKGATLAAARRALSRAHCAAGKVTRKKSAKVGTGRVISSTPGAGSKRKSGTRVNLTVSRGKH